MRMQEILYKWIGMFVCGWIAIAGGLCHAQNSIPKPEQNNAEISAAQTTIAQVVAEPAH